MSLRALVVDDEPLARAGLVRLLRATPGFEVAGEARDGPAAVAAVRSLRPDLMLLDVNIPAGDGFEVIRQVGPEQMPMVIFVTAHDEHAVRAFESHALDYVLKPFDDARLRAALQRAAQLPGASDLAVRLRTLIAEGSTPPALSRLARAMLLELDPQAAAAPVRPAWLERALELLHARPAEPLGLAALARSVGVHRVHLARGFRAHLGATAGDYHRRLRVESAAELLVATQRSIAEIALETGFSDQSHLTRVFRRALGVTPARYRGRFRRF